MVETPLPQIRHQGAADVRGKIRRVWRPRYLQVYDNALVRYYELPEGSLDHDSEPALIPKYTLAIYAARILDVTTLRDMHVGLPRGTFGFLFRGQRLVHLEYSALSAIACRQEAVKEQRDFLCAVGSLEEAQMWVVALQWASRHYSTSSLPMEPWWAVEDNEAEDFLWEDVVDGQGRTRTRSSTASPKARTTPVAARPVPATAATPASTPTTAPAPAAPPKLGKVVVSKVVQYRVVRIAGLEYELAYEIHGMLLRGRSAEEWSMLRTAGDLQRLVETLHAELGPHLLDRSQLSPLRRLPRLKDQPNAKALRQSLSIVDSMLRSMVMDAAMVNATAMKNFLGLSSSTPLPSASLSWRWIQSHHSQSILSRTTSTVPASTAADQYVKQWLGQRNHARLPPSTQDIMAMRFLDRPWLWLSVAGLSAAAAVPAVRLWSHLPVVAIRVDYLVASWMSAAALGRWYERPHIPALTVPAERAKMNKAVVAATKPLLKDSSLLVDTERDVQSSLIDEVVEDEEESDGEEMDEDREESYDARLSSPLPECPANGSMSCWSKPSDGIFHVRGVNYLSDRVKVPSDSSPLTCRGVDVWITDNPERNIARHPAVLGGKLGEQDTFLVNFLLPFGNFVAYFEIPPLDDFPEKLRDVWTKFLQGDQEYRDARLKLLPYVVEGPWIVKTAVGPGKSPALLGKVIPLQYYFRDPDETNKGVYEVDVIITASTIAKGILSVVKGHTKSVSIAFAFIIEAAEQEELPETVLCSFQVHNLCLEDCPMLPEYNLDA